MSIAFPLITDPFFYAVSVPAVLLLGVPFPLALRLRVREGCRVGGGVGASWAQFWVVARYGRLRGYDSGRG